MKDNNELIKQILELIKLYPNDADLGAQLRSLLRNNKI